MPRDATIEGPPGLAGRSTPTQRCDALTQLPNLALQLPNLAPQLRDFIAQFGHGPDRIGELCGAAGVGSQEGTLALVAHREAVRRQLPDGGAGDGHCDLVRLLELCERGELTGVGELAIRDTAPQVIGHLLIGELAGPLDHLHPKSRLGLCLIVPKPQR